jgi:hypothetical protein
MLPSVTGSNGSLKRGIGPAYRHRAAVVERTSISALNLLPMGRDPNLMGPNKGRCRCLDSCFRSPGADFLVWTDWNGPQLSWALCLSDWRLGWCSSDVLPQGPPRPSSRTGHASLFAEVLIEEARDLGEHFHGLGGAAY